MKASDFEVRFSQPSPSFQTETISDCSRMLLAGVSKSVLVVRNSGAIAFANTAFERMTGKSTAEIQGRLLSSVFQEDRFAKPSNYSTLGNSCRGRLSMSSGAVLPVRIDISPIHSLEGETQGSVVTIEDLSDMLQMDQLVKQISKSDPLTGLPRAEVLHDRVEAALTHLHTTGRSFALLELNVDNFRRIRESLGHDAADNTLREVAARLTRQIQASDVLARSAGGGFTLLLNDCGSHEVAVARAEAVLKPFEQPFHFGPYSTRITASIGMSFAKPGTLAGAGLFTEAELAVRRCKALGGDRVICFDSSMADWRSHAVQMESNMQKALAHQEFYVVYQPQVCCKTGRLIGVEALLRWQSPDGGLVMPTVFIPAAEESGLIVPLGEWCMRKACEEVVALQQRLGYSIRLAVNVSPKQVHAVGFKDFVRQTLEQTGLNPRDLELEITEGLLMSHEEEAQKAIRSLQELGLSVAMDDFGMGFSNLSYITRFKIDRLKIDRSFVSRCLDDHNSRVITTSLVFLAKSLGIEVVAEGVETQEQATFLSDMQCDLAQGHLFSKPTTAAAIFEMARQSIAFTGERADTLEEPGAQQAAAPLPQAFAPSVVPAASSPAAALMIAASPLQIGTIVTPLPAGASGEAPAPSQQDVRDNSSLLQPSAAVPVSNELVTSAFACEVPDDHVERGSDAAETQDLTTDENKTFPANSGMPQFVLPPDAAHWLRFSDDAFATHTILVAPKEQKRNTREQKAKPTEKPGARQTAATQRNGDPIEPREPLCRPVHPPRAANAMRVRWVSVPVDNLPN